MVTDTEKAHVLVQVLLNLKEGKLTEHIQYEMWCEGAVEAFLTETVIPGYSPEAVQGMNETIDWLYELIVDDPAIYVQMESSDNWIQSSNADAFKKAQFKRLVGKIRSVVLRELKQLIQ